MSQFRTTFDIPAPSVVIGYESPIMSIGSCFAVHIADRLKHYLYDVQSNPRGIIFNPVSLATTVQHLIHEKPIERNDLVEHGGLFHSWDHHHSYSNSDSAEMLKQLNNGHAFARVHLLKSKFLLVTFGTAFAYQYRATGKIVANCHKIPNSEFDKIRLSDHRIVGEWQDTIDFLHRVNPDLQIIMTVSPVRHIKDGIVANQRSKSTLLLAIESLTHQFENVHYFPSYEIMMDDLRDYRFYNNDMLHPSQEAVDYIWNKFVGSFISDKTQSIMKEVDQIQKARAHRSMHPESESSINFQKSTEAKWKDLLETYPQLKRN